MVGTARVQRRMEESKGSPDATECVKLSPPDQIVGDYHCEVRLVSCMYAVGARVGMGGM